MDKEAGIQNKYLCFESANESFVVNIISMIANFFIYNILKEIPHASDEAWHKTMTFLGINILVQTIFAFTCTVTVVTEQVNNMNECWSVMNHIYIRQYIYIVFNFSMIGQQMFSLATMFRTYKLSDSTIKNNFAYREEPEIRVKM